VIPPPPPRIAVFGGSFDPVHRGHLHCARAAVRAFGVDHVVFVPAARPPHKPGVRLSDGAERLAMLELALAGEPAFSVWDAELGRPGPSFTIDTARELVRLRGGSSGVHLILGGDNVAGLRDWRDVEELLRLVQPIVVRRAGALRAELEQLAELSPAARARLAAGLIEIDPVPVSASDLRARLARGEACGDDLPPGVGEYARRAGIYRPRT